MQKLFMLLTRGRKRHFFCLLFEIEDVLQSCQLFYRYQNHMCGKTLCLFVHFYAYYQLRVLWGNNILFFSTALHHLFACPCKIPLCLFLSTNRLHLGKVWGLTKQKVTFHMLIMNFLLCISRTVIKIGILVLHSERIMGRKLL